MACALLRELADICGGSCKACAWLRGLADPCCGSCKARALLCGLADPCGGSSKACAWLRMARAPLRTLAEARARVKIEKTCGRVENCGGEGVESIVSASHKF